MAHSKGAWDNMYPEERVTVNKLSLGDKTGLHILAYKNVIQKFECDKRKVPHIK